MDHEEAIRHAERAVWEALLTGDTGADRALLAEDFLGVYPDGFAGRDAHAAQLDAGASVLSYDISEEHVRPLGADHMLIAYRATYLRPASAAPETMLVSSIWERRGKGWINIFSQDTPLTGVTVP